MNFMQKIRGGSEGLYSFVIEKLPTPSVI